MSDTYLEDQPRPADEHRFPCDQCGADLRFDPGQDQLICDHCGNTHAISDGPWRGGSLQELDFRNAVSGDMPEDEIEETRVVSCPNCGAQTDFDESVHSAECPFCATPVVTDTGLHRHIKPKGLLPFALDERAARMTMTNWLGSLWFAPNGLKEYARKGRTLSGIYVPYWTFDADTKSKYTGQRGTHYYENKTVTRNGKREQVRVRKTRWRGVSGRVARFFDDVLVLGSKSLPKKYTDALEPWDLSAMEPYQPEYLAGFRAEGYSIELEEAFKEARHYMDRVIHHDVKFDIGGDAQQVSSVDTKIGTLTFKHVLLPVWMAAYKYRGSTYRFVVNGRTGRVQGERPFSAIKIAIAVFFGLIIAGCIGFVIANSQ
jgi:ribosomal protein S27E